MSSNQPPDDFVLFHLLERKRPCSQSVIIFEIDNNEKKKSILLRKMIINCLTVNKRKKKKKKKRQSDEKNVPKRRKNILEQIFIRTERERERENIRNSYYEIKCKSNSKGFSVQIQVI